MRLRLLLKLMLIAIHINLQRSRTVSDALLLRLVVVEDVEFWVVNSRVCGFNTNISIAFVQNTDRSRSCMLRYKRT